MSLDSDLLDDILAPPANGPERALGKFKPKARRKNEKVVQQPVSSDRPLQDGERVPVEKAPNHSDEGRMDVTEFPLCNSNSDDCLRRDPGSSVGQTEITLPGSDCLDDMLPQLETLTGRVMEEFQPKVRPSASKLVPPSSSTTCTHKSLSSGLDPSHGSPSPFEAQEFIRNSYPENSVSNGDKELWTDSGRSEEKETRVLTSLEPSRDGLLQAAEAFEAPVLDAAASGIEHDLQTDQGPSVGETTGATFDMGSIDKNSPQPDMSTYLETIVPDHNVDLQVDHGRLQGEGDLGLYEDIPLQPTLVAARVGKFHPKLGPKRKKTKAIASDNCVAVEPAGSAFSPEIESSGSPVLAFPPDSSTSLEHPTNDMLRENASASGLEAAYPGSHRNSDNSHAIMDENRMNTPGGRSLRQEAFGEAVEDHSQGILDGCGSTTEFFEANDAKKSVRELRKRTRVCTVVNEPDDGSEDDRELGADKSNDSQMDDESSDDEYMGPMSSKKRAPRKSRGFQGEKEKTTWIHEKTSFGSDSPTQEPQRKRFSHSTRRSKRQVDKVLLEAPEEDIDPMKLKITDLIMLAETRERIAVKEAAATKQSMQDQSDNSFCNNSSFGNDNDEQGLNVDGDEADHTVHFSSTKLNYHTYMSRTHSERWSKVDTELFYQAVRQFGTDFAMIQQLFPNRTRHQIKLKFKNEERKHPLQIADALVHRSKDHSHFELVIQRLQAQEEENSNVDAANDTRDESETKTTENEEEDHVKADKKEEQEVDDWDQAHDSANPNEYQDVFDWSQYEFHNSSSPYGMEKDEYNTF